MIRERRVKIAVLDTGLEVTNQTSKDFKHRIRKQENFLDPEGDASDAHGHGTYCAGLIHRVAPEADIYAGKIVDVHQHGIKEHNVARVSRLLTIILCLCPWFPSSLGHRLMNA